MAYRIDPDLPLDGEFRRIAAELIGKAEAALADPPVRPEAIAVARRRMKKLRGLLRLARPALGEECYRKENWRYRDCGRALSRRRDASAAIEALDLLDASEPASKPADMEIIAPRDLTSVPSQLRATLSDRRNRLAPVAACDPDPAERVLAELKAGRLQLGALPLATLDPQTCVAGLSRIYRQAAAGLGRVRSQPDTAAFHDWRKRVKYHWMHLRLIRDIWPAPLNARALHCKRLSDLLGDANDLAVLKAVLDGDPALGSMADDPGELAARIGRARSTLHAQALALGEDLFLRDADWFCERIALVWRSASAHRRRPLAQRAAE